MNFNFKSFIFGFILAIILTTGISTYAESKTKTIEAAFNKVNLKVNNQPILADNILYNNVTYIPLRTLSNILNFDIVWDSSSFTANIIPRSETVIQDPNIPKSGDLKTQPPNNKNTDAFELNLSYAIKSFDQYNKFINEDTMSRVNSVGFYWSRLEYDPYTKKSTLNTSSNNDNPYFVPYKYEIPLNYFHSSSKSTLLAITASGYFNEIFSNQQDICSNINKKVNEIGFNGVLIDFKNLPQTMEDKFTNFLFELKKKLNENNKKLYVVIPPVYKNTNYTYNLISIASTADKIILSANNFNAKSYPSNLTVNNIISTPLTPIDEVEYAIKNLTSNIKPEKILLQLYFTSCQWKIKDNKLFNKTNSELVFPLTPSYDSIYQQILTELKAKKQTSSFMFFDETFKNPYITYHDSSDNTHNVVWYENSRSIVDKIKLAKKYGLGGISIWRLGIIPDYNDSVGSYVDLNVWKKILNEMK